MISKKYKQMLFILIGLIYSVSFAASDDVNINSPKKLAFRITPGIGVAYPDNVWAYGISIAFQVDNHQFIFRGLNMDLLEEDTPLDRDHVRERSLLYGYVLSHGKYGYISTAAGIGYIKGIEDKTSFTNASLPLEAQFMVTTPLIGFGVTTFANVNSIQVYYGWLFNLQFGKLR